MLERIRAFIKTRKSSMVTTAFSYTRHSYRGDVFLTPKISLQYGLKSIRYTGAKMWNDLPEEIQNSSSKCSFKKHLKKYILNSL